MVSPPAVTVVIATYNWSSVLPYAIASVLDQTMTDFELLVVGDHCTDDSADVVTAVDDERVRWHNLDVHTGHQSGPNNEGLRLARGSIIAYLGHDDLWLPHHLETLVGAIRHGAHIAFGQTLMVWPEETPEVIPGRWWGYRPDAWIPPTAMAHERDLGLRAGGWRPPAETGVWAPETDLLRHMVALERPPKLVPRLTNVKLPAARRPNVYRLRPSDEQSWWLARVREAEDPERMLFAMSKSRGPSALIQAVRARVSLRTRLGLRRSQPTSFAEDRVRQSQRYKGVEE
ncbi:MAG TPA: glycosyltransferase family A protein [Acidimicrobiales bacterium]|nr:glycosyltransferase family A protein [Acidimicrobiales bacterium]